MRHAPTTPRPDGPRSRSNLACAGASLALLAACASGPERDVVRLHAAFGTATDIVVEGRVLEDVVAPREASENDRSRVNLRRNASLFTSEECDECPVDLVVDGASARRTITDDEGFFRVELGPPADGPAGDVATDGVETGDGSTDDIATGAAARDGWRPLLATSGGTETRGAVLVVPPDNRLGIVSDIDDTVLVTEVGDRYRMLGNTFFRNPLQRDAVEGMASLYERILASNPRPDAAPLFYLSSSPRELNGYLGAFLEWNGFPRGVLITRRLTLDRIGYERLDSVAYKTARLVDILERLPDVTFVLVGDDGENDPRIYEGVRERYPDRIAAIWIRRANPLGPALLPAGQVELGAVLDGRVPLPTLQSVTPLAGDAAGPRSLPTLAGTALR